MLEGDGVVMVSPGWGRAGQNPQGAGAGALISTECLTASSSHSLLRGSHSPILPPRSLHMCYLLPVSSQNCLHFCGSGPAPFPLLFPPFPSISMAVMLSPPLFSPELHLEVSQPNPCLSITHSSLFWIENLPGFFWI